jgi:hypothetical protein
MTSAAPARVGVIGPTNVARISAATGIPEAVYADTARTVGGMLAQLGVTLVVVPDRGVARHALAGYRAAGGQRVLGLAPVGGECDPEARSILQAGATDCDDVVSDLTWYEQHARFCHVCDLMVGVGLSCGTLAEIAWTKWVRKPEALILRSTISLIPPEIMAEARIRLIDGLPELAAELDKWYRHYTLPQVVLSARNGSDVQAPTGAR